MVQAGLIIVGILVLGVILAALKVIAEWWRRERESEQEKVAG